MDRMRFRHVSASETNDVSATFLLSHFRSFLFPLRFWSPTFFPFLLIARSMFQQFCLYEQPR